MSQMKEDHRDQLITETIQASLDSVEVPPVEEEWKKFEAKYGDRLFHLSDSEQYLANLFTQKDLRKQENKTVYLFKPKIQTDLEQHQTVPKSSLKSLRSIAVACLIFVVLALSFSLAVPEKASAIGEWLFQFFRVKTGETTENIHMSYQSSGQQVGEYTEIKPIEANLEDAQKKCPYQIGIPGYLPGTIQERKIFYEEINGVFSVQINYYAHGRNIITLDQQSFAGDNAFTRGNDTDDSATKMINIRDSQALLFEYKNRNSEIVWNNNYVFYRLRGELSPEELIKVAESID